MKQFFKKHTILVFYLLMVVLVGIAVAANWDVDSDNDQKVDGEAEAFGSGWDGDVNAPQKNDLYDYLIDSPTFAAVTVTGTVSAADGNFIVDSDGVANASDSPTISGYHDTDAESVWSMGAVDADVNTATGDTTTRLKTLVGNSLTDFIVLNGSDERVNVLKPLSFGTSYETNPSSPVTIDSDICRQYFTIASNTTFNLPAEPECNGESGSAKEFCFKVRVDSTVTLDPATGDSMQYGDAASCTPGVTLTNSGSATRGDFICIFGRDSGGTDYWTDLSNTGTWACGS